MNIFKSVMTITRLNFLNGSPFARVVWMNYFGKTASATSLVSSFAVPATRLMVSTSAWTVLAGLFCAVLHVWSKLIMTTHFIASK